jgi:alkaline phosphatase D
MLLGSAPAIVHALGDPQGGSLFTLGVASGDPDAGSVVLWTRLAPDPLNGGGLRQHRVPVDIEVALDPGFINVVRRGRRLARREDGHVINLRVGGLPSDTRLYYRFRAQGQQSAVGCTRTFPRWFDSPERVRFAVVSCQNYAQGFYNAFGDIADLGQAGELDFVIHTGDYIYEGGPTGILGLAGLDRDHEAPNAEVFTVEEYRNRYALYRLDPDLQRAHGALPFIVTWDDHEVENNYAGLADENGSPANEFARRRRDAYQVYRESMPMVPRNRVLRGNGELRIYRSLDFGDLAQVCMLDTRQYRSDQPAGDNFGSTDTDPPLSQPEQALLEEVFAEELFDRDGILDPGTTLLGLKQEAWLARQLKQSRARWNVLAQQTMVTQWNLVTTGRLNAALGLGGTLPPPLDGVLAKLETLWNVDAWDGYPAARRRLFDLIDATDPSNPVFVTGDIHSSWGANLLEDFDNPDSRIVAGEFVGTSVASTFLSPDPRPVHEIVRRGVDADNPHIPYFNGLFRGYMHCELDADAWTTTFRSVVSSYDEADLLSPDPAAPFTLGLVPLPGIPVRTDAVLKLASGFRNSNDRIQVESRETLPDFLPFLP